jgi:formylglycine-generating enzyme required for sulfatase activity
MAGRLLMWRYRDGDGDAERGFQALDLDDRPRIPLPDTGVLELRGTAETLVIEVVRRADGEGLSQTGGRLLRTLPGDSPRELGWLPPGLYPTKGSGDRPRRHGRVHKGGYMDSVLWRDLMVNGLPANDWADAVGRDPYGIYAELEIKGVTQRFRWLPPGEFLMGSPDGELERNIGEDQHLVTLSRGLWLADTACTQALWVAVMGENPSGFNGPDRPVERVSWHYVNQFIERLNRLCPGLDARLPTETEWEYGCRAGTDTPFSFGSTITTEQVNYNGNHPEGLEERGEFRQQTVEVKALPCNPWGLYQMHGNVWEWCADRCMAKSWASDHPGGRTVRGGSWSDTAGWARSAFRCCGQTDGIRTDTGRRLARD